MDIEIQSFIVYEYEQCSVSEERLRYIHEYLYSEQELHNWIKEYGTEFYRFGVLFLDDTHLDIDPLSKVDLFKQVVSQMEWIECR